MAHSLPRSPRPGGVDYNSMCNIDQEMFTTIYKWLDKTKTGARGLANPNDEENKKNLRAAVEKLYRYIKGGQAGLRRLSAARRKALIEVVDILELSTRDMNPAYSRGLHDNLVQATDYLATLLSQPDDGNPPRWNLELHLSVDPRDWSLGYDPPPYDGPIYSQPAIQVTEGYPASPEPRRRSGIPVRIAKRPSSSSFITPEHPRRQQSERYSPSPRGSSTKMQQTFHSNIPRYVGPEQSFNQTSQSTHSSPHSDNSALIDYSPFEMPQLPELPPAPSLRGDLPLQQPVVQRIPNLAEDLSRVRLQSPSDIRAPYLPFDGPARRSPPSPSRQPRNNRPTSSTPQTPSSDYLEHLPPPWPLSDPQVDLNRVVSPSLQVVPRRVPQTDPGTYNAVSPSQVRRGHYTPHRRAHEGSSPVGEEEEHTPPRWSPSRPIRTNLFGMAYKESPSTPDTHPHQSLRMRPADTLPLYKTSAFAAGVTGASTPPRAGVQEESSPPREYAAGMIEASTPPGDDIPLIPQTETFSIEDAVNSSNDSPANCWSCFKK